MNAAPPISLDTLRAAAAGVPDRFALWTRIIRSAGVRTMAEIGVRRGAFAAAILEACPSIERYWLVDPWRELSDWNKPMNGPADVHEECYRETVRVTAPYANRCTFLRGTTLEVADRIPDGSIDLVYIDGDHTLRGIVIDLIRLWPKVRAGGIMGGDDFTPSIWQHSDRYEPSLVCPYARHFAEAIGAPMLAPGHDQFLIHKDGGGSYRLVDPAGRYANTDLLAQCRPRTDAATGRGRGIMSRLKLLWRR